VLNALVVMARVYLDNDTGTMEMIQCESLSKENSYYHWIRIVV